MPFFAIKLALFLHLYDLFPVRSVLFIVDTTCFVRLISSLFTPPSELELNFTLQPILKIAESVRSCPRRKGEAVAPHHQIFILPMWIVDKLTCRGYNRFMQKAKPFSENRGENAESFNRRKST